MDFEEKSGRLWQCIGERRDTFPDSGLIYRFRIHPELIEDVCNKPDVLAQQMWPAVEPAEITNLRSEVIDELPDAFHPLPDKFQIPSLLAFLGYGAISPSGYVKDEIIDLPDLRTLQVRWACLKRRYPNLKSLGIVMSDGIADDMGFAEAFVAHDALLSSGKEFVHDHFFHIQVLIENLWHTRGKVGQYDALKKPHVDRVKSAHALLRAYETNVEGLKDKVVSDGVAISDKEFALLKTSLGLVADTLSAAENRRLERLKDYNCITHDWSEMVEWNPPGSHQYFRSIDKTCLLKVKEHWSSIQASAKSLSLDVDGPELRGSGLDSRPNPLRAHGASAGFFQLPPEPENAGGGVSPEAHGSDPGAAL